MPNTRTILVSGSSRGLGKELAAQFQEHGFRVITMGNVTPGNVSIRCDLLDLSALEVELKKVFDIYGAIDILVCNAGTGKKPSNLMSDRGAREFFFEKNFETSKNLVIAALPYLKTPGASIVGVSSIVALAELPGVPDGYAEAKVAMNQLFKNLAQQLAIKGIRVNLVSPGNIMFSGSRWEEITLENPKFVEELLRDKVPLHQFITPEEIATAIIYLSSAQAKNITGINLVIDGGQIL
jgi:3-oxoacyl-[acyl-carrier protein] reductase